MDIDYTEVIIALITAVIGFLGVVVTRVLVPFIKFKIEEAKSKLSKDQREKVEYWTRKAVLAIEKAYEGESKQGPVKKEQVMIFINKLNLDIDQEVLKVLVDAVVEELINNPIIELIE